MSCVYKGSVIETDLSRNSKGGTEQMRSRLLKHVDSNLLSKVAIHFSRPRVLHDDVPNILYCHDLASDPENKILMDSGWKNFAKLVFVSAWQRDQYIEKFNIPYSACAVIQNSIELKYSHEPKDTETVRFIYHTTPHRGLELAVPIFEHLTQEYKNIHFDVYSSFGVYGWESRDLPYKPLFDRITKNPQMTYHGAVSNDQVLEALKKSHIFLYPCIWKETSCIALIEAIRSGCIAIHPNYGALPETAAGVTVMYDYSEDLQTHAQTVWKTAKSILDIHKQHPNIFNTLSGTANFTLQTHDIENFKMKWDSILSEITRGR